MPFLWTTSADLCLSDRSAHTLVLLAWPCCPRQFPWRTGYFSLFPHDGRVPPLVGMEDLQLTWPMWQYGMPVRPTRRDTGLRELRWCQTALAPLPDWTAEETDHPRCTHPGIENARFGWVSGSCWRNGSCRVAMLSAGMVASSLARDGLAAFTDGMFDHFLTASGRSFWRCMLVTLTIRRLPAG